MRDEKLYLKRNVLVEPLFNRWYAWSYLVAPHTAAMYVANSHVKILQSFASNPQVHINALKNAKMLGGPFVSFGIDKVPEVKALLEKTLDSQAPLMRFAEAVHGLDRMLASEATGESLEPLYRKVPDVLKGYVELVYDLNNNPSIRFIEGLLYNSPFYNPSSQSLELSLVESNDRPFVFSTPRVGEGGRLSLEVPFKFEGLDELFKTKKTPQPYGAVKEAMGISDKDDELFSSFFTEEAPPPPQRYTGEDVRVRYYGHACILIESAEANVLFDPVISYEYDAGASRFTYADLPEVIDNVVITHNHQDHCMFETLLQLRHKIKRIIVPKSNGGALADPSLKMILKQTGFRDVVEVDEAETIEIPGGDITGLPFLGEHADLNIRSKLAFLVKMKGKTILCAADSNNIEPQLYEHISNFIEDLDVFFIGMECEGGPLSWLHGALLTKPITRKIDQSRRFDGSDFRKGIDIVDRLKPKQVYVYAMGQEPWLIFLTSIQYTDSSLPIVESNKLVEECRKRGIPSERLYCQKEILLKD